MKRVLLKIDNHLHCFQNTDKTVCFVVMACKSNKVSEKKALKVHKRENFFGSDFEFFIIL